MFGLVGHERDREAFDALNARLWKARGQASPTNALLAALLAGRHGEAEEAFVELDRHQPTVDVGYPMAVANWTGNYGTAERLALSQTRSKNPPHVRVAGHLNLARIFLAGGQWRRAAAQLDAAEAVERAAARSLRAALATLPFLSVPDDDLARSRREIADWTPAAPEPGSPPSSAYDRQVRLHLLGLLSSKLGEAGSALAYADSIEALDDVAGTAVPGDLATTVRADVAWRSGRPPGEVLAALEPLQGHVPAFFWNDPVFGQEHARWLRVSALIESGEHTEALRWLDNGFVITPGWVYNSGPVAHLKARALEALGRAGEAADARRTYGELWSNADAGIGLPR